MYQHYHDYIGLMHIATFIGGNTLLQPEPRFRKGGISPLENQYGSTVLLIVETY